MGKVHEINHPMVQHKLTHMRNKDTSFQTFQKLCSEIATLLAYEASRDFEVTNVEIETPLQKTEKPILKNKDIVIVPILRAGLGMVDGISFLFPNAKIGHIGLFRDEETKQPVEYFLKLPEDIDEREVFIIDPMLATGGSAIAAIDSLKKHTKKDIKLLNILASPEGVEAVQKAHPDVDIYCAAIDEELDENKYIRPGLGDAGDRLYGTM